MLIILKILKCMSVSILESKKKRQIGRMWMSISELKRRTGNENEQRLHAMHSCMIDERMIVVPSTQKWQRERERMRVCVRACLCVLECIHNPWDNQTFADSVRWQLFQTLTLSRPLPSAHYVSLQPRTYKTYNHHCARLLMLWTP